MIPAIGLMVGLYIIVRMFEIIGNEARGWPIKAFAGFTILVTAVSIVDIMNKGSSIG